ncbi:uncharacterized protein SPPG_02173 [Spizellomyces punctatus DAOM BR117]|uniref:Uncharacterized protein n=1 Tax=Spizellomyces punctatus (strain DAOM BR117) TaxID=645134 RepID=A0A0L0HPV1_SPIPD|nr:uncharacterized protein SPPG_02160 [Spizellomyces punctatus DAOM BR117]XP_016611151.1 uncharacterized protein SPPG_02173 [Spizellomyces punctatus DAOM BR117]KND03096.1 hypothetical protein SPPG_02160 [Spizellomyces punctatus DAOM BR117]KND03112.1 hypothetical protein SPPG_02173 [Spizellomyces punctatus DAOM BR117]|eukprot:XP_016611135.1 hypothetical protein SPPG_02160 [Spizellomyces punctatus DAOM BR117]
MQKEHDSSDENDMLDSVPPPPTRRRGSVLDDAIMRDMLGKRAAPAEGQEDREERERMERMYVMLRWSKRYRAALVRDANASFAADVEAASSPSEASTSFTQLSTPSTSSTMSNLDMTARRSSMSTGSFGAGRMFAKDELDAALAGLELDSAAASSHLDVSSAEASRRGSDSYEEPTEVVCRPLTATTGVLTRKRPSTDRPKRRVQFAEEVKLIPPEELIDDEGGDADNELSGDESGEIEENESNQSITPMETSDANIITATSNKNSTSSDEDEEEGEEAQKIDVKSKSPAVKKLTKAFKRAFLGAKPQVRVVHAA